jgi:chemotaxis protein methyltransferase CheR
MNHEEHLNEISQNIIKLLGINFQANQFPDMERRMKAAAKELAIDVSVSNISDWLSKSNFSTLELNTLSAHLTINETYFFREKPALDLFQQRIIPELIEQRRGKNEQLRIWSAGCSSGEEPYSLAMILQYYFPELKTWDITILATDISPTAIQKALHGEYTDWSFRDTEDTLKNKYFTSTGKNWKIASEIKKMVTFSYLNLSKNAYPSSLTNTDNMDVIFCRNVMMYFTPQVIHEVSSRFRSAIIDDGWFITSQVELNDEYFGNFERVNYNNGIFYQKSLPKKAVVKTQNVRINPISSIKREKKVEKTITPKKSIIFTTGKHDQITKPTAEKHRKTQNPAEFYEKGEYQQCIECCLQNVENENLSKEVFSLLVKSFANSGKLNEGEKTIQKIISNQSATAEMYYIYASYLNEQSDNHQSELLLKKAIYLNHKHVLSHLMLGDLFLKKEKNNMAVKHYETVIALLDQYHENELVPDSDGLTAGRIKALAESVIINL